MADRFDIPIMHAAVATIGCSDSINVGANIGVTVNRVINMVQLDSHEVLVLAR